MQIFLLFLLSWAVTSSPTNDLPPADLDGTNSNSYEYDAAFHYEGKIAYFFKGDQYLKYDFDAGTLANYPRAVAPIWKGMTWTSVDAVIKLSTNNKIYFFKGDEYIRYDFKEGADPNYPKKISQYWPGIPNNVDAAVDTGGGLVYFIKGTTLYKYDTKINKVVQKSTLPGGISGIRAATCYRDVNNKVYLYGNNGKYWRLNNWQIDGNYPQDLSRYWGTAKFGNTTSGSMPAGNPKTVSGSKAQIVTDHPSENKVEDRNRYDPGKENAAGYVCTTRKYNVSSSFNENYLMSSSVPGIFPGNIISAKSYANGSITRVPGRRKPVTISSSIQKGNRQTVEPTESAVRGAVYQTLPASNQIVPNAGMLLTTQAFEDKSELRVGMRAGYDGGIHKVDASGSITSNSHSNRVFVRFAQVYYTVDVDMPTYNRGDQLFSDGTSITHDMMLINQVGYGRLVYMTVETNYSAQEIKAMVSYINNTPGNKIDAQVDAKYEKIANSSRFSVYTVGGRSDSAAKLLTGGLKELKNYLEEGSTFNRNVAGVPIFYRMKFASSGDDANVRLTSTVTERDCVQTSGKFRAKFDKVIVFEVDDPGGNEEIYGIGWMRIAVTHGQTGKVIKVAPDRTIGSYQRVYEIFPGKPKEISKNDMTPLMSGYSNFKLRAKDYGYNSMDQLLKNSYWEFTFEVKEEDVGDDDIFGKENFRGSLATTKTRSLSDQDMRRSRNTVAPPRPGEDPGLMLHFQHGGSRVGVSIVAEPVSN